MKDMFTDTHVQVESGNDIFDGPHQVVRRHFPNRGVIWFEKPAIDGEGLQKYSKRTSELLEEAYASNPSKVIK